MKGRFVVWTLMLGLCGGLSGCASTQVDVTGKRPSGSLCQPWGQKLSALVLWQAQWRRDQKEVPKREALAELGLQRFLTTSGCYGQSRLQRVASSQPLAELTPQAIQKLAAKLRPKPDRLVLLTLRELGPVLRLFTPVLLEGGTEVLFETRVFQPTRTGKVKELADFRLHWQNDGPWVIKGVGTLDADMTSALTAALVPLGPLTRIDQP